jgi:hypothetical protein
VNSLAVLSDNIKSILKISSSISDTDRLDILVILLWEVFTKIALGLWDRHKPLVVVALVADIVIYNAKTKNTNLFSHSEPPVLRLA